MFFSDSTDNVIYKIIYQVFKVQLSGLLTLLVCQKYRLIFLELRFGFFELCCHLVVPLFDSFKNAWILVVLIGSNLFFSLLNLSVFKLL